ncbi:MAG: S8 family serine peptidase, partial [Chloroflexi bacterium]|nr:S8 family serine peptidase [Chloroflexota bacterium]
MEARTAAKILIWLQSTATGDRNELNLIGPESGIWPRLSAQGLDDQTGLCTFARRGMCFYQAARRRADGAHLVVVNHALLALDAVHDGLLPEYRHLIIDEAHNLEEVVTNQWGAVVDEDALDALLDRVSGSGSGGVGMIAPLSSLARSLALGEARRQDLSAIVEEVQANVRSVLGPEDATRVVGFQTTPALGATITASGLEKLRNHPDVTSIGAAELGSFSLDESRSLIWANTVHAAGYDGTGINVAVLDSGIDTNHPDLVDSIVDQICFSAYTACGGPFNPAEDINGHGTMVSGTITSDGTVAPLGIAPEAGIYAYRVSSNVVVNGNAVAAALEDLRLRSYPVDFVNMSFGLTPPDYAGTCDIASTEEVPFDLIELELAGLRLIGGVLPFAASGNQGNKSGLPFPACNEFVVSVGAVYDASFGSLNWIGTCSDSSTAPDKVACASNSSAVLDLLAPGCKVTSTKLGGGSQWFCGTSFATPIAVGVAAGLKSAYPSLTPDEIL